MHEHAVVSDYVAGDAHPEQVGMEPFEFCSNNTDILASFRYFDLIDRFNSHSVSKRM